MRVAEAELAAPLLIDKREASRLTSLPLRTLDRYWTSGRMPPPLRVGGRRLWRRCDIENWIAAGCQRIGGVK